MKLLSRAILLSCALASAAPALAEDYVVDKEGAHAFVQFRVKHLGYSWLYGRFNDFDGKFTFDEKNPEKNSVTINLNTASIDSNHARRDKHIRSEDFLDVKKYPKAQFVSTSYTKTGDKTGELKGNLTMHGTTKPITIQVEHIGGGSDPWGGYRQGFEGRAKIKPSEWGIPMVDKLGPASEEVELFLSIEGIRQKAK